VRTTSFRRSGPIAPSTFDRAFVGFIAPADRLYFVPQIASELALDGEPQ
jgi:hypothetical protein